MTLVADQPPSKLVSQPAKLSERIQLYQSLEGVGLVFVTRWWLQENWCSNTYIYIENWNKIVVLESIKLSDMECSRRLAVKNIWSVESSGTKILDTSYNPGFFWAWRLLVFSVDLLWTVMMRWPLE